MHYPASPVLPFVSQPSLSLSVFVHLFVPLFFSSSWLSNISLLFMFYLLSFSSSFYLYFSLCFLYALFLHLAYPYLTSLPLYQLPLTRPPLILSLTSPSPVMIC